jgi:hypothetical protein
MRSQSFGFVDRSGSILQLLFAVISLFLCFLGSPALMHHLTASWVPERNNMLVNHQILSVTVNLTDCRDSQLPK